MGSLAGEPSLVDLRVCYFSTLGSVRVHVDRRLGPWEQRPVFKTNVTLVSLRTVAPPIALFDLQRPPESRT